MKIIIENKNWQAVFTLIELVLTISVLAVMAISAIPSDNGLTPMSLDAGARKVKTDIRYAQNLATTTGSPYGFRATGASTYEVYEVSTGDIALSPYTNTPMQEDLTANFGGIVFDDVTYTVEFNAYGRPNVGGGTTLVLTLGDDTKSIQITATSGYINLL